MNSERCDDDDEGLTDCLSSSSCSSPLADRSYAGWNALFNHHGWRRCHRLEKSSSTERHTRQRNRKTSSRPQRLCCGHDRRHDVLLKLLTAEDPPNTSVRSDVRKCLWPLNSSGRNVVNISSYVHNNSSTEAPINCTITHELQRVWMNFDRLFPQSEVNFLKFLVLYCLFFNYYHFYQQTYLMGRFRLFFPLTLGRCSLSSVVVSARIRRFVKCHHDVWTLVQLRTGSRE